MMRSSSTTGNSSSTSGTISCHDCGNKAKRDCSHSRCRTCCKSRGFPCATHVKSTWVPVARRRHRQHQQHQRQQFHLLPSSTLDYHHLNLPLSLSRPTTFHHHSSPPGREGGEFPAEVNSLATFRCIRVRSEDNVVEQYAYQTSIDIGGHIFKGILYDQGPAASASNAGDQSSSAGTSEHHHHQFSLAGATSATAQSGGGGGGANLLYPPHPHPHPHPPLYSAPFNAFLPGMQFFPHPKP